MGVTPEELQEEAKIFAMRNNISGFAGTKRWLNRFYRDYPDI